MLRPQPNFIRTLWIAAVFLAMAGFARANVDSPGPYAETRQVLAELVASGQAAQAHYRQSEHRARFEDQPYIANLFKAMATSQAVMNRNFEALLAALGGETALCADFGSALASTRQNLIAAIQYEIHETDKVYPQALARIRHEGHRGAVDMLKQALRAQQLRRRDMRQIRMGARYFYSRLEKEIQRRAPIYRICQQSGALLVGELPAICPVRGSATTSYRSLHMFSSLSHRQACQPLTTARRL